MKEFEVPLAERMRPRTLDEYCGQRHLMGPGAPLRTLIEAGRVPSCILYGPPGVGKTTLVSTARPGMRGCRNSRSAEQPPTTSLDG